VWCCVTRAWRRACQPASSLGKSLFSPCHRVRWAGRQCGTPDGWVRYEGQAPAGVPAHPVSAAACAALGIPSGNAEALGARSLTALMPDAYPLAASWSELSVPGSISFLGSKVMADSHRYHTVPERLRCVGTGFAKGTGSSNPSPKGQSAALPPRYSTVRSWSPYAASRQGVLVPLSAQHDYGLQSENDIIHSFQHSQLLAEYRLPDLVEKCRRPRLSGG
jgi:hypothetical protein